MASKDATFSPSLPVFRMTLAETGFAALLLLVFVGLHPFALRDAMALQGADEPGAGNLLRQISYLAVFASLAVATYARMGLALLRAVPLSLLVLLIWCAASALWAGEPFVAFRRAMLEWAIVWAVFLGTNLLGARRSLVMLRWILGIVLIVNLAAVPLLPQAVHLPGEADPSIIGDWRGLYFHKNIAGAVSAMTALVFFFAFLEGKRWWNALAAAGAVFFTVMTHSKTSLALLPGACLAGALYAFSLPRRLDRQIVLVTASLLGFAATLAILWEWQKIAQFLADPTELSGRAAIWQAELRSIADHPLLGAGFGSLADTGAQSPLRDYISSAWIANISHGHSGYLQLLVTLGAIGFVLAMWPLVVLPLWRFLTADARHALPKGLLFSIFVFALFHNVLESDYLEGDAPVWVLLLLAIAAMKSFREAKP